MFGSILGAASTEWKFKEHHSGFIQLISESWEICEAQLTAHDMGHEDRITRRLVMQIKKSPAMSEAPYSLAPQHAVYSDETGDGKVDIALLFGSGSRYLAYEAKCLNTPDAKAAEYVKEGMLDRFIKNKYASDMTCSGMIGYVYDGDLARAEKNLTNAFNANSHALLLSDDAIVWTAGQTQTLHARTPIAITLSHLLLPVTNSRLHPPKR